MTATDPKSVVSLSNYVKLDKLLNHIETKDTVIKRFKYLIKRLKYHKVSNVIFDNAVTRYDYLNRELKPRIVK